VLKDIQGLESDQLRTLYRNLAELVDPYEYTPGDEVEWETLQWDRQEEADHPSV
jgi:hypothetical protein